jgi:NCAIR mutase (PurE)-related protein
VSKEGVLEQLERAATKGFVEVDGVGRLDVDRVDRRGLPEVIYCEHKTPEEVRKLFLELMHHSPVVLGTRASPEHFAPLAEVAGIEYHPRARIIRLLQAKPEEKGLVLVLSAGTSDIPVAQEAALTASSFGSRVKTIFDVGVAGIHRILSYREELNRARALVVVAGMDGALPSVVGGLAKVPVIAVPTSTGYGASFGGVSALLSMLNSCSPGVSVVNIDNGFGAGYQAHVINAQSIGANYDHDRAE